MALSVTVDPRRRRHCRCRPAALFPDRRGARLLTSEGTVHRADLISGLCHAPLLGLHAAADLDARVVEVYGPFHPKLAIMPLEDLSPSTVPSYSQLQVSRLHSYMTRFSSIKITCVLGTGEDLSAAETLARGCCSVRHHISRPHPAPLGASIHTLADPSINCDGSAVMALSAGEPH